ncbi:MAG: type II toxin-antitoxin system Phd/YefM family antitoxin [Acidimicrobiales bacterium]
MDVAVSELRANLKTYVDRARAGERVVVTERGVPVARLVPVDAEGLLERLERGGALTRPKVAKRPVASKTRRVKAGGPVADLVAEQRRDRDDRLLR